jgi:hypothetical protein
VTAGASEGWWKTTFRHPAGILGTRAVALPLAAGNTVVLKGSELSPKCFWALGVVLPVKLTLRTAWWAMRALVTAGASEGWWKTTFRLLELGGKASAIVLDDANLDKAAMNCAIGSFMHVCTCGRSDNRTDHCATGEVNLAYSLVGDEGVGDGGSVGDRFGRCELG